MGKFVPGLRSISSKVPLKTEVLATHVVESAYRVYNELGPGLLENAYEVCLFHELIEANLPVERQVELPIRYRNIRIDAGYRLDLWINRALIVEIKSVEKLAPIHTAQLLTYLRLSNNRLGFLINFNAPNFQQGLKRIIL